MTIVGKILVFVNLIFSLVVSGIAVAAYTARFHYDAAYKDLNKQYKVAQANAEQFYQELQKVKSEADGNVAGVNAQTKALRDEIEGYKVQLAGTATKIADAEARYNQAAMAAKAAQVDAARRQADVEQIRDTLAKEHQENFLLKKDKNEMRDRAVAAEIQAKSLQDLNLRMEKQLQETVKDLARAKANGGTSGHTLPNGANPPPEDVVGRVTIADSSGYLKLSIGSDDGLVNGNTLEMYRTDPKALYLGRVRIVDVRPHEAVAQPIGRLNDKPRSGDRVASRILPNGA